MIARAGSCVRRNAIVTAIVAASAWALSGAPADAQGYPQAANGGSVIVNYGALAPAYSASVYGAPVYSTPAYGVPAYGAPAGYAPYVAGSPLPRSTVTQPYSVATPYGAQPYARPYIAPLRSGDRYAPAATGFVPYGPVPYGQTTAPFGTYAEKVVLKNPSKKKKKKKATTDADFAGPVASTQTADATAGMEAAPQAPSGSGTLAVPTPPAEPDTMPTNVPSPVPTTPAEAAAVPEAPVVPAPPAATEPTPEAAATASAADAVATPADQQAAVIPEAPAEETPAAETPAEPDPNASAALPAGGVRIVFEGDADDLPQSSTGDLDQIAQKMLADESMRVQVMAYATGTVETENKARRKSLARGLAVRSYLIKAGVRSTRIDVRALGSKSEGSPADRVDVVPAS